MYSLSFSLLECPFHKVVGSLSNLVMLLEVLENLELALIIVGEDLAASPVASDHLIVGLVKKRRHLVSKHVPDWRVRYLLDHLGLDIEVVGIAQEFS